MTKDTIITVGLDVHKVMISACWLRGDSQVEEMREFVNEPAVIHKFFKKLSGQGTVRACYEAGCCGYTIRRQLEEMGIACAVIEIGRASCRERV